jgi:hypothetical protein
LLFTLAVLLPRYASAAVAVPMCSAYGECMVAPPPEAPPTGGEIRLIGYGDPHLPGFEAAPSHDPKPVPWQVPSPDLAVILMSPLVFVAPATTTDQPPFSEIHGVAFGVRTEVYRPPCRN